MRKYSVILFLLCLAFAKAQLQSSHWYFGLNGGIDFNSGAATASGDGQLITGEGCASISDSNGNLLFYTDGTVVYDKNHTLMPNGSGLLGNSSSTSSAIIVPYPGNSNLYYVFTVNTNDNFYRNALGLYYSVVDMNLNNGNGDIDSSQKNVNLLPLTSEKLTAISNESGDGYWMLTQYGNTFYAYAITSSGLNTTPITSNAAPFIELVNTNFSNVDVVNMRGYMKLNTRGDKLVAAHFSNNTLIDFNGITNIQHARSIAYAQGGELYLYDFNNATGIVSNPRPLMTRASGGSFYGVEFSGNGRYLYAEIDYYNPSTVQVIDLNYGEIAQWDLTAANIAASKTTIYTDDFFPFRGALQLGLDNRIYHSRLNQTALSVLNNPDSILGAPTYTLNDFQLFPGTFAFYGLPIFVQSFLLDGTIRATDHCFGESINLSIETSGIIDTIQWDFGDINSGLSNTSTLINPAHIYSAPGIYTVTATVTTLVNSFTLIRQITVYEDVSTINNLDPIILCDTGFNIASFNLSMIPALVNNINSQRVSIHASLQDALQSSNDIDPNLQFLNTANPQTLYVRVSNDHCFTILEQELLVNKCPIQVYNVVTPNNDGFNDTFIVSGLRDVYPYHKIFIFTRYGQKIWEGNNDSPDWDGVANTGLAYTNRKLPTGTYFYVIELNEPNSQPIAGYLYLTGD